MSKASIYSELSRCFAALAALEGGAPAANGSRYAVAAGAVADDRELDSEKGNPTVRKDPPRWRGESCVGMRLSECSVAFLESYVEFKAWSAANPRAGADPKYTEYDLKDCARGRGWIRRMSGAGAAPVVSSADAHIDAAFAQAGDAIGDDDLPFAPNAFESR